MDQDSGYMTAKRKTPPNGNTEPGTTTFGKENNPSTSNIGGKQTGRKARKALHATWSTPGNIHVPGISDTPSFLPETPVSSMFYIICVVDMVNVLYCPVSKIYFIRQSKSLIGDSSVLFSPPSIIRETLPETHCTDGNFGHPPGRLNTSNSSTNSRSPDKVDVRWEMVAYGRTRDQVELTKLARSYLVTDSRRTVPLACKKKFAF